MATFHGRQVGSSLNRDGNEKRGTTGARRLEIDCSDQRLGLSIGPGGHEEADRDSSLTTFGNLEIMDIHGAGYKHVGGAAMHLVVFIYRNRLCLLLGTWGKFLTEAECNDFMDVLVHEINRATQLLTNAAPSIYSHTTH